MAFAHVFQYNVVNTVVNVLISFYLKNAEYSKYCNFYCLGSSENASGVELLSSVLKNEWD